MDLNLVDSITYAVIKAKLGRENAISNDVYSFARRAYNKVYKQVWDRFPWKNQKYLNISATTTDGVIWFDRFVSDIRSVRTSDNVVLDPISDIRLAQNAPALIDNAGMASSYMHISDSPVKKDLTTELASGSMVSVKNLGASGSTTVRIEGRDANDNFMFEEITAAAASTGVGTKSFYSITAISKNETQGDVQVVDKDTVSDIWAEMSPGQTMAIYKRIQLVPIVDTSTPVKIMALRRFEPLWADRQVCMIPLAADALVDLTAAELFEYTEDYDKAQVERQKGWDNAAIAVETECTKSERDNSYRPRLGMFGDNDRFGSNLSPTGY